MPPIAITSAEDERVAVYRQLPHAASGRRGRCFVVEGKWLVERLIASEVEVVSILCGEQQADFFARAAADWPVFVAPKEVLDRIVGFDFHRGVLACGVRPSETPLDDLVQDFARATLLAACTGVCDQENLGSVVRNCLALGAGGLLLDTQCADPYSRRVMRVSAGAALRLPIVETGELARDLAWLKHERDFRLVATVLDRDATPLEHATVHQRSLLVFGNEGYGVEDSMLQICDDRVTLPMQNEVDSLNVGVASGIFLHHYYRGRTAARESL